MNKNQSQEIKKKALDTVVVTSYRSIRIKKKPFMMGKRPSQSKKISQ